MGTFETWALVHCQNTTREAGGSMTSWDLFRSARDLDDGRGESPRSKTRRLLIQTGDAYSTRRWCLSCTYTCQNFFCTPSSRAQLPSSPGRCIRGVPSQVIWHWRSRDEFPLPTTPPSPSLSAVTHRPLGLSSHLPTYLHGMLAVLPISRCLQGWIRAGLCGSFSPLIPMHAREVDFRICTSSSPLYPCSPPLCIRKWS